MFKVLVADPLADEGLQILKTQPDLAVTVRTGMKPQELIEEIPGYDALIVRSESRVTKEVIEAGKSLKVVGRAGIGVDNIDCDAATQRGIVVMNTPGGNSVTTAEHTLSLMMSMARMIPQATQSLREGKWEKKKFKGVELCGKTLGLVGIGNIGGIVADRANGLKMKVIAYDPFITRERAASMGVEICELDDVFRRADFITVHTPLNDQTRGIVGKRAIDLMKKGVRIINCARGGIVDEVALLEGLQSGKVAGAALDVFVDEPPPADHPLLKHENVVFTPHLGASTTEAQIQVSVQVAQQIVDYLTKGVVMAAVNSPAISAELAPVLRPYIRLAERLGSFHAQIHPEGFDAIEIEYGGSVADVDTKPLSVAVLRGLMHGLGTESVNYVNAPLMAKARGMKVTETKVNTSSDYAAYIRISTRHQGGSPQVAEGAMFGKNDPRIVRINDVSVEARPEGAMLVFSNLDRPGVIGNVGKLMEKYQVNVGNLTLGRDRAGGKAISIISVDNAAPAEALAEMAKLPNIEQVFQVKF